MMFFNAGTEMAYVDGWPVAPNSTYVLGGGYLMHITRYVMLTFGNGGGTQNVTVQRLYYTGKEIVL